MKFSRNLMFTFVLAIFSAFLPQDLAAQTNDIYEPGTVWEVTTIRMHANMNEEYLGRLRNTWIATMDKAKAAGVIMDYKVLLGRASNAADYNLLLMIEFKNYGELDPSAKRDEIMDKIIAEAEADPEFEKSVARYGEIRDLLGSKYMREITFK